MKWLFRVVFLFVLLLSLSITASAKSTSSTERGWLGVYTRSVDYDLTEMRNLGVKYGAIITHVVEDSPADKAGLKKDDVIIAVDKEKVTDTDDLIYLLEKKHPGDNATLTIIRNDERENIDVTLGETPDEFDYNSKDFSFDDEDFSFDFHMKERGYLGVTLSDLTEQLGEYFGVKDGKGALVTAVDEDSPAEKAGLKAGDVITAIDGEDVEDSEDISEIISEHKKGDNVNIIVVRNNRRVRVTAELDETKDFFSSMPRAFAYHGPNIRKHYFPGVPDSYFDEDKLGEFLKNLKDLRIKLKKGSGISSDEDNDSDKELEIEITRGDDTTPDSEDLQELRKELKELRKELQDIKKKLQ